MVAHQPQDRVRPVLALGKRRVARRLALGFRHANLRVGQMQAMVLVRLALGDLLARQLAGHDRVHALDALRGFAVGDRLHLKRMQAAEHRDLVEGKAGVVDQPDRGRLWHQERIGHKIISSRSPASLSRAVVKPPNFWEIAAYIAVFAAGSKILCLRKQASPTWIGGSRRRLRRRTCHGIVVACHPSEISAIPKHGLFSNSLRETPPCPATRHYLRSPQRLQPRFRCRPMPTRCSTASRASRSPTTCPPTSRRRRPPRRKSSRSAKTA